MSYQSEMEARWGTANVKQWSNQGPNSNTSTINTTAIAAALVDVQGDFREIAGVIYDETDNRMLKIACARGVYYLKKQGGAQGGFKALGEETEKDLRDLRKVTNANRLVPRNKLTNPIPDNLTKKSFADNNKLRRLGHNTLSQTANYQHEGDFD